MNDKLNELFRICGINDFIFTYQKEGDKNYIDYSVEPEKKIVVNLPDLKDKELNDLLTSKIEELKELFK